MLYYNRLAIQYFVDNESGTKWLWYYRSCLRAMLQLLYQMYDKLELLLTHKLLPTIIFMIVTQPILWIRIYIIKAVMSVCLFVCSVWPAKWLGRSRPNLTHALMSTQGVFLARSMSRSLMYACGSDRITKHPQSDTWRTAHYGAHTTSGQRRRRHLANEITVTSRTPSGGQVLTASNI